MDVLLDKLKQVLREEDIEDIISLGAPQDEYDMEAEKICSAVSSLAISQRNEENIVSAISLVWDEYFGPFSEDEISSRMPEFQKLAAVFL